MITAVYPGSFDPCTNGHLDIIIRSSKIFDKLIVAVLSNSGKTPVFSVDERMEFLRIVTKKLPNVEIDSFSGLLAEYTKACGASVIIKGLRAVSDFEYEFQMSLINTKLNPKVETLFMTASTHNMYLSSSLVKEIAVLGGALDGMVPEEIQSSIYDKLRR
ncbi:MAG: Phosphopantetheine adenylyltransferase [Firmicutes bacterium ADurb.Bin193]|nr:MAG: Phosphopantetheine adenylyltransferase [Firmicutes bacterium ADurb.Bin193]